MVNQQILTIFLKSFYTCNEETQQKTIKEIFERTKQEKQEKFEKKEILLISHLCTSNNASIVFNLLTESFLEKLEKETNFNNEKILKFPQNFVFKEVTIFNNILVNNRSIFNPFLEKFLVSLHPKNEISKEISKKNFQKFFCLVSFSEQIFSVFLEIFLDFFSSHQFFGGLDVPENFVFDFDFIDLLEHILLRYFHHLVPLSHFVVAFLERFTNSENLFYKDLLSFFLFQVKKIYFYYFLFLLNYLHFILFIFIFILTIYFYYLFILFSLFYFYYLFSLFYLFYFIFYFILFIYFIFIKIIFKIV